MLPITRFLLMVLLLTFVQPSPSLHAQTNLLLNGGFEDINTCTEYKSECGVEGWFYLKEVKARMLHNETDTGLLGNNSFAIFQTWAGYTGFTPVIGTILPCGLQPGKRYIFRGMILARLPARLLLEPGICLGERFYVPGRAFSKTLEPLRIHTLTPVPHTSYFSFEYVFTAGSQSRYLTFGSFIREDSTGTGKKITGHPGLSFQLDNFQLVPEDPEESYCPGFAQNKDLVYAYDSRHREMDYALFGKGDLGIRLNEDPVQFSTRAGVQPKSPALPQPDTLKLGDVFFDFNQSKLKPAALNMLSRYFESSSGNRDIDSIRIEGHTDSIGSDQRNMALSAARCNAVKNWLLEKQLLPPADLYILPFGRSRPIATNRTAAGRAQNRRVEIIIFRKKQ